MLFMQHAAKDKTEKSRRGEVDTWMSPEALQGGGGRTKKGGRKARGPGSFFQLFPLMCVCVWSICALVLEELNRGSYQMDTHR